MSKLTNVWNYVRPLIEGVDEKLSLKNCIAITFVVGFIYNVNKSTEGVLGIMAGLIAGLLGLQVYNNLNQRKIDNEHDENTGGDDNCDDKGTNGGRGGTS